jgi:hypothetical protein
MYKITKHDEIPTPNPQPHKIDEHKKLDERPNLDEKAQEQK